MSLTLKEIYEATQNKYRLNLITDSHTLKKVMSWVYIGEDITTFDYLNGGELVISTGLCIHDTHELYDFIHSLIDHGSSGLIINIGGYLKTYHITSEIRNLCNIKNFALLTMPWEISFQAITKDYYNRIFLDNQTEHTLTDSFLSILRRDHEFERSMTLLDEAGFSSQEPHCICVLNYQLRSDAVSTPYSSEEWQKQLLYSVDNLLHDISLKHHIMLYKDMIVFICCSPNLTEIQNTMNYILEKLEIQCSRYSCRIGIGSVTTNLSELFISYKRAVAALTFAEYQKKSIYSFSEMGVFRLLLSVHDTSLLQLYLNEQLGVLISYDKEHHSNYLDTLYHYIMLNGSIQSIANTMYCHRNTVNYRVKNLKNLLHCDLDDMRVRFDFLTAFCIKKYLELGENFIQ